MSRLLSETDLERTRALAEELLRQERELEESPPPDPDLVRAQVDLALPAGGLGAEAAWDKVARVLALTPKTSSPRFFNQLFAGREPLAGAAEMLTGLLNSSMYTYKVAGVHTLIENEVVARLCAAAGLVGGEGTFVPGGSMGNLVGLQMAAFERRPELRDRGLQGRRLRAYVSQDGHYSVRKSFGIMGLGRENVRRVRTDEQGRMQLADLERKIAEDRAAGHEPACVVATAGTTVAGAFDPVEGVAEIAEREGLWLHVDAAFGGSFLLHPEQRKKLAGVERADSMTWNAHKMMGVPMPCAAVLVRVRGKLRKHFNEAADYLYQQDTEDLNLGTKSLQCGRRNDAFKLWAAWQELGDRGWAERIDRQLELVAAAVRRIEDEPELELACPPQSLNICFTVLDRPSDLVCERLSRLGQAQVGYGVLNGRKVIRLVTVNPTLSEVDIERFFDALLIAAREIEPVRYGTPETVAAAEAG